MTRSFIGCVALIVFAVPASSQTLEVAPSSTAYDVHTWTIRDGLPQSDVTSLAQTQDGSLWIGTFGGLVRFDGLAFEIFDTSTTPALKSSRITALATARDGTLWIGTQSAGLARRTRLGFEMLALDWGPRGTPSITALFEDSNRRIWIASSFGLAWVDGARAEWIDDIRHNVSSIAEDASGTLWIANWTELSTLRDGVVSSVAQDDYRAVIAARDGSVWCGLTGGRVERRRGDSRELIRLPTDREIAGLVEDARGAIWFDVDPPMIWQAGRVETPCTETVQVLESARSGRAALADKEGSIWLGRSGVSQFRASPVQGFIALPLIESSPRTLTFEADGALLLGLYNDCAARFEHGTFERVPGIQFQSMAVRADGSLLLGATRTGIQRLERRALVEAPRTPPLVDGERFALLEDRRGALWVSGGQSLQRIRDSVSRSWSVADGLPGGVISNLLESSDGSSVWVASANGLARIDGDRVARKWICGVDLPSGEARALFEDEPFGWWVGIYGGGLCRIDPSGDVHAIGQAQGLAESVVSAIVDDRAGHVLLLGNRSISRVSRRELDEVADGKQKRVNAEVFDSIPGLPSFEAMGGAMPGFARAPDGTIWFPALGGVVRFDPSVGLAPPPAPIVVVRSLRADGVERAIEPTVSVAPGARNLEVEFSASTFVDPSRARFSYRLDRYDAEWVDAGTRRSAIYTRVPPGRYRFEVRAANSDGVWSGDIASFELDLEPWFYETAWFKVLVACAALLVSAAVIQLRTLSSRRRARELERTVAARTRELQETRDRLEQMVVERTEELEHALRDLRQDMAHREKLEARLRQSEKLEVVGRLAAGLAHDFNNILTAVLGEAEVARDKLESGDGRSADATEHLTRIENAALRAANLTRQLLSYGRRQVLQPVVVDVNVSVRELEPILRRLVREDVELALELSREPCCVHIDPGQLEQVIVNLVVNARDALDAGGRIVLATSKWSTDVVHEGGESSEATRYVVFSVQDNGVGIEDAILADIFEPFFTTKPQGKGTGLGLASVNAIVEQSGGHIRVASRSGVGSKFEILLPEVADSPAAIHPAARSTEVRATRATILLVDDDLSILDATSQILRRDGHRVLVANRAVAALEIVRANETPIDLVISDMVMPELSGQALAAKLRALRPNLKVILTSGYTTEDLRPDASDPAGYEFLAKPFKASVLRRRVDDCLNRREGAANVDSNERSIGGASRGSSAT